MNYNYANYTNNIYNFFLYIYYKRKLLFLQFNITQMTRKERDKKNSERGKERHEAKKDWIKWWKGGRNSAGDCEEANKKERAMTCLLEPPFRCLPPFSPPRFRCFAAPRAQPQPSEPDTETLVLPLDGPKERREIVRLAWEKLVRWSRSLQSRAKTDVLERTNKVITL